MNSLQRYVAGRPGELSRLAKAASVSIGQMSRIVNRKRGASIRVVRVLSRETGIPVAEIVDSIMLDDGETERARA